MNVNWSDIARNCTGQSVTQLSSNENPCYSWSVLDSFVKLAKQQNIQLLFSVSRSPYWVNNNDNPMYVGTSSVEFNRFIANYTAFITAIGSRYNHASSVGEVRLWTIWNEPNSAQFWQPLRTRAQVNALPLRYAILYSKAAVALRKANTGASIAPGPTGPAPSKGLAPATFITQFQRHALRYLPGKTVTAKRSYINAWAHNPYPYVKSPRLKSSKFKKLNYPNLPIQQVDLLVKTLDRSPLTRGRLVWATEFGYETYPDERVAGVSRIAQGRLMAESFDVLDKTRRVSIAIWYGLTDPTDPVDWQSGSYFANGALKPSALWMRRPVSVNVSRVNRGGIVEVWGRSNIYPTKTRIQYSFNKRSWRTLSAKKQRDGSIRTRVRVSRTMYFSVWDGASRGPAVVVVAR